MERRLDSFVDVFASQNLPLDSMFRNAKHGAANLFGACNVAWEHFAQERECGFGEGVVDSVGRCSGLLAVRGFDGCWAKDIAVEWQAEDGIFCLALDAGPHNSALFRTIGANGEDEDEGHLGVESCQRFCGSCGDSVGYAVVVGFFHAGRGNS